MRTCYKMDSYFPINFKQKCNRFETAVFMLTISAKMLIQNEWKGI